MSVKEFEGAAKMRSDDERFIDFDNLLYILNHGNEPQIRTLVAYLAELKKEVESMRGLENHIKCPLCYQLYLKLPDREEPEFHKCDGMKKRPPLF
ncbi:MAG: hypothetical protein HOE64_07770 [Nitrospina sp.]|nr:hypothetical protein [Nitrospina sp.]